MHVRTLSTLLAILVAIAVSGCDSDGPLTPQDCTGIELDGTCWTLLGLDSDWVVDIAVTPWGTYVSTLDHGILLLDADGRWNALGPDLWHDHLIANALLYVPADPPRLLAGVRYRHGPEEDTTIATVFASSDRGESWTPSDGGFAAEAPNPYRVYAEDLEVDPGDPRRVFMSFMWSGVLRSLDAGETWQLIAGDPGLSGGSQADILIDPNRSGWIWVAVTDLVGWPRVAASDDWGETWGKGSTVECGMPNTEAVPSLHALALDPNPIWRVFGGRRLWAGVSGYVMWADNGGEVNGDWQCHTWDPGEGPWGEVVDFAELERTLFAATVGSIARLTGLGLYHTFGGVTWDSLPVPPGVLGATVAVTDSANGRLLIGTRGGLWAVRP